MMLASGQVVLTATGRPTTPFPRIDISTDRRAASTLRRVEAWLIGNAVAEAQARGDRWMSGQLGCVDLGNLSTADMDSAHLYLFGDTEEVGR